MPSRKPFAAIMSTYPLSAEEDSATIAVVRYRHDTKYEYSTMLLSEFSEESYLLQQEAEQHAAEVIRLRAVRN